VKELGIILDFWTKEITIDEIPLPMRDIKNQRSRAAANKVWTMNICIDQNMSNKLQSTLKATKCLPEILDVNYEKANLRAITKEECLNQLTATERTSC
jgi:hypothetical protein